MKGDFTRNTFDPTKDFTRVLKQQGRVDLDADWNEDGEIQSFLDSLHDLDVIGAAGVPKKAPGFQITILPDGSDLMLSAGRLYLSNWLAQKNTPGAVGYKSQPYLPYPPELNPAAGRTDLVYLEGWQRHITAAEDPSLLEPALGGADTTTRLKMIWQVKVRKDVGAVECSTGLSDWPPVPPLELRGKLTTGVASGSTAELPCEINPAGGYVGLENRLYRVEIHDGGLPFTWPRPVSAVGQAVTYVNQNRIKVTALNLDGSDLLTGQALELFSQNTDAAAVPGTLLSITAINSGTLEVDVDQDISSMAGHTGLQIRRIATFKWSRDNGSVVYPIQQFVSGEPAKVQVNRLGRDQVLALHANEWVEVLGDHSELLGVPGTLTQIQPSGIDESRRVLTLGSPVAKHKTEPFAKVRRWDQAGPALAVTHQALILEDGVQVQFSGETFLTGDYWSFESRTATGAVAALNDAPPQGIERRFARLALITWQTSSEDGSWKASEVRPCTPTFPPLTDIWASDVYYDDGACDQIEARTVQEAIDALCKQRSLPFHNKHLHGWGIVCGLRVVCGPEDFSEPGDQISVVVKPGYALDCEGNDIVIEQDLQVMVLEMIQKWQQEHPNDPPLLTEKNGKRSGQINLIIERGAHGEPQVSLRRYEPKDDSLQAMLKGTLLMDFIQKCILNPLKEIQDYLQKPTSDVDQGSLVTSQRQQAITLLNLLIQVFKPQYGSHVFLSQKEHTILENLYYKLVEILISQTFCGMFHDVPFPDYPFPKHQIDTLFGSELYKRFRIHPTGRLGYALGINEHISVFDLKKGILVEQLEFPGGKDMVVQDVAFSVEGDQVFVVATTSGGDSMFASAQIKDDRHKWQPPVKPVCGLRLVTLVNTARSLKQLYAIGNGEGLFLLDTQGDVIRPHLVAEFAAVGHLLIDEDLATAYATAGESKGANIPVTEYRQVLAIQLEEEQVIAEYPLPNAAIGDDDIALLIPDRLPDVFKNLDLNEKSRLLFVVANPPAGQTGNKQLVVFNSLEPGKPIAMINLESDTTIRLLPSPVSPHLVISYEDEYWLRLLDLRKFSLLPDFHLPVQISPIGLAYDPLFDQADNRKIELKEGRGNFYVLNALSSTLTTFPAVYLDPRKPLIEPVPGSDEFLEILMAYRAQILQAFLGLLSGLIQSLKDCFCDRLLVDCPTCDPEDDVYLAKVTIKNDEIFQVCNFSRRKYVKSFPTMEYWLSLVPILPMIDKAVESFCCAILPDFFEVFGKGRFATNVKGAQMRQSYGFVQQQGLQNLAQQVMTRVGLVRKASTDWAGSGLSKITAPAFGTVRQQAVLQQDVDQAKASLEAAKVEVAGVEKYDAADGLQNLRRISGAPVNLPQGAKVTLYAENGIVRYYTLAEEGAPKAAPAEASAVQPAPAAPAADLANLQAELQAFKAQAASKDEELAALRTQLQALESRQVKELSLLRKDLDRLSRG